MNDQEICREIEPFLKQELPSRMLIDARYIDSDIVVRNMILLLDQLPVILEQTAPSFMSVLPIIFGIEDVCGGREISIVAGNTLRFAIRDLKRDFKRVKIERIEISLSQVVEHILNQSVKCRFSYIPVNVIWESEVHSNLIFIYSNDSQITLALYEPQGSTSVHPDALIALKQITVLLRKRVKKEVTFLDVYRVSCPIGLQKASKDNKGYCMSFSLFWLYMVLKSMRNQAVFDKISEHFREKDNVSLILTHTEQAILNCEFVRENPKILLTVIRNFAVWLFNRYIEYIYSVSPESAKLFMQGFIQANPIFLEMSRNNPEYSGFFYGYENPEWEIDETEFEKRVNAGSEKSFRRKDNKACERDDDCLSDNCVDGKCIPYEY